LLAYCQYWLSGHATGAYGRALGSNASVSISMTLTMYRGVPITTLSSAGHEHLPERGTDERGRTSPMST
jgi:hypothetical protein